jgi:hypothetical protein
LARRDEELRALIERPAVTTDGILGQQLALGRVQGFEEVLRMLDDIDKEMSRE